MQLSGVFTEFRIYQALDFGRERQGGRMITLRSSKYNKSDFLFLRKVFSRGKDSVCSNYGKKNCAECEHKMVCSEIEYVLQHIDNKLSEK